MYKQHQVTEIISYYGPLKEIVKLPTETRFGMGTWYAVAYQQSICIVSGNTLKEHYQLLDTDGKLLSSTTHMCCCGLFLIIVTTDTFTSTVHVYDNHSFRHLISKHYDLLLMISAIAPISMDWSVAVAVNNCMTHESFIDILPISDKIFNIDDIIRIDVPHTSHGILTLSYNTWRHQLVIVTRLEINILDMTSYSIIQTIIPEIAEQYFQCAYIIDGYKMIQTFQHSRAIYVWSWRKYIKKSGYRWMKQRMFHVSCDNTLQYYIKDVSVMDDHSVMLLLQDRVVLFDVHVGIRFSIYGAYPLFVRGTQMNLIVAREIQNNKNQLSKGLLTVFTPKRTPQQRKRKYSSCSVVQLTI